MTTTISIIIFHASEESSAWNIIKDIHTLPILPIHRQLITWDVEDRWSNQFIWYSKQYLQYHCHSGKYGNYHAGLDIIPYLERFKNAWDHLYCPKLSIYSNMVNLLNEKQIRCPKTIEETVKLPALNPQIIRDCIIDFLEPWDVLKLASLCHEFYDVIYPNLRRMKVCYCYMVQTECRTLQIFAYRNGLIKRITTLCFEAEPEPNKMKYMRMCSKYAPTYGFGYNVHRNNGYTFQVEPEELMDADGVFQIADSNPVPYSSIQITPAQLTNKGPYGFYFSEIETDEAQYMINELLPYPIQCNDQGYETRVSVDNDYKTKTAINHFKAISDPTSFYRPYSEKKITDGDILTLAAKAGFWIPQTKHLINDLDVYHSNNRVRTSAYIMDFCNLSLFNVAHVIDSQVSVHTSIDGSITCDRQCITTQAGILVTDRDGCHIYGGSSIFDIHTYRSGKGYEHASDYKGSIPGRPGKQIKHDLNSGETVYLMPSHDPTYSYTITVIDHKVVDVAIIPNA